MTIKTDALPRLKEDNSQSIYQKPFYPWIAWGIGASVFFTVYFVLVSPSLMASDLMRDFHIHATTFGRLSALFLYAYVGMQLPVGILLDRFGPRRLLPFNTLIFGSACMVFAMAHTLHVAELGRFVMGLSGGFAFIGALKLGSTWFPSSRFGLITGLTQALGMIGAAVGEGPMSLLISHVGWRHYMTILGIILFVQGALLILFVPDSPTDRVHEESDALPDLKENIFSGIRIVLSNPRSWVNALYGGFLYCPISVFAELWAPKFLEQTYQVSAEIAAWGGSMIFVGWAIGGPIIGWWSDKIKRRRSVMMLSTLGSFLLLCPVLFIPSMPISTVFVLLFLFGICNTGLIPAFALSTEISPRELAGTALAFINMMTVVVGALLQPVVGWILELRWDGIMVDGAPVYSASAFHTAMFILPVCLLVAFILTVMTKETYCKPLES